MSVNKLDRSISPIILKAIDEKMNETLNASSPDADSEKSVEISLRVYNKENAIENHQVENEVFCPVRY